MIDLKDNAFKPISFWSWNGVMEERELRDQIRDFKKKGFGGFFIHSRAGRLIPYMGPQWMAACRAAADEAVHIGLDVWLYDEDGWPSGFAGGLVNGKGKDFWARHLEFSAHRPTEQYENLISAYKKIGDEYEKTDADDETAELFCVERLVPTYVDLMNPKVTKEFIKVTHEVYKSELGEYFGKTVKGIFTDEPQLLGDYPWSSEIEKAYRAEYGEDIRNSLWKLKMCDGGYEFKYRYRKLTNKLFSESYVKPINKWCEQNGLAFTGHFGCEDGLVEQLRSNGGVMTFYSAMNMPGIDHLGNRFAPINLMKQVSSVANRHGLPYVLSESFGCSGWNVAFKDLAAMAGWQGVFGINMLCLHLSAYTITGRRKRDYPAFFSYQEPWWEQMDTLNKYFCKLFSALSAGKRPVHTAVIHPMGSVWCLNAEDAKFISAEFRVLQESLNDLHWDYDLIDEGELADAGVCDGVIKAGNISYDIVIIPESFTLAATTVEILEKFTLTGGTLYFISEKPRTIEGSYTHSAIGKLEKLPSTEIQNSRNILQKVLRAEAIDRPFALLDSRLENESEGIVCRYITSNTEKKLFCFNKSDNLCFSILRHRGNCSVSEYDLLCDTKVPIKTVFDGKYTYADIKVPPKNGKLFLIGEKNVNDETVCIKTEISEIAFSEISPVYPNSFTLDVGRFSLFDEEYSEEKNIVNCADEIYGRISKSNIDAPLRVEYTFKAEFADTVSRLYLAFEKNRCVTVKVNGTDANTECGWFVDKNICRLDISSLITNGENKIELRYIIPNAHKVNDLKDKFESERNRFFYNVEPENIYLIGDFDVVCHGKVSVNPEVITVTPQKNGNTFVLTNASPKKIDELTKQGMWFYRGDVLYGAEINYAEDGRYYISSLDLKGVLATVLIDNTEVGKIFSDYDRLDITKYLKFGKNRVSVRLYGSNRNLMGPHHHITGEPHFVGPSTFRGIKGFEDFVTPEIRSENTYTDNYSFVPFGISKIRLTIEKAERGSADI